MKRFISILVACLVSQGAWAGWSVTYKDAETGARSRHFYENGKVNVGQIIYTGKNIVVLDENAQAYWQGTPQQYCDALRAQRQKFESHLAALPAQYRPVPISKKKVTRKKLGRETIAGFSATGYEFYIDGGQTGRVWVSSDPGVSGIIDIEKSMSRKTKCLEGMDSASLEGSRLYKQTVKGKFVLKESHREVASIEKKIIPAGSFAEPGGYQAFAEYEQFMNHISKRAGSSAGPSSRPAAPSFNAPPERPRRESRQGPEEPDQETQEDNVVVKDAKDIVRGAADETRQTTKRGIQDKTSERVEKGVKKMLDKWF